MLCGVFGNMNSSYPVKKGVSRRFLRQRMIPALSGHVGIVRRHHTTYRFIAGYLQPLCCVVYLVLLARCGCNI